MLKRHAYRIDRRGRPHANPDPALFGIAAFDEMLAGVCSAHIGNFESCALTCGEACAGEQELLRWAVRYDGSVRVARANYATARRAAQLAALARAASRIDTWPEP